MKYALFNHAKQMAILVQIGRKARQIPYVGLLLSKFIEYTIRIVFSSDISCAADIASDVEFVHGHDIVIGGSVIVGRGCKIFNGVTLGNKDTETDINQQPHIGENCVISTGAKILGHITIGKNSVVGANAVVLIDIPENSVAVGVPARFVARRRDGGPL